MKNLNLRNKLKSIICFVVATLQIVLYGCNQEPDDALPEQIEILENAIISAPEGEYDGEKNRLYDAECPEFEIVVANLLTDIVKATYSTTKVFNNAHVHLFKVIESFRGEIETETIYVWAKINDRDCHEYKVEYEKGKDYLLLLERKSDPFISFDTFESIHPTISIPLDAFGAPDIPKSRICNYDLLSSLTSKELIRACTEGQLVPYLLQITKDNPSKETFNGFTETYDKDFAIRNAEYVLKISVQSQPFKEYFLDPHIGLFNVDIAKQNILKGDKESLPNSIGIYLPVTISNGDYIVAINDTEIYQDVKRFIPSTRNSIYPTADYAEVLEIINTVNDNES